MISAVTLGVLLFVQAPRLETKLSEMEPVASFGTTALVKDPFSFGGMIGQSGIGCSLNKTGQKTSATFVYQVPPNSAAFKGVFGIRDEEGAQGAEGILGIYVDGDLVKEQRVEFNQKPVKIEINLNKASAMKFVFEGGGILADGVFTALKPFAPVAKPVEKKAPTQAPETKTNDLGRVNLLTPEVGQTFKSKVKFTWDKVEGAVSYGVEVILIRNDDETKLPTRFLRAYPAARESFEWNFSEDVVSGEYQVSVIAFGKSGVITKFSNSRRFKIVRN